MKSILLYLSLILVLASCIEIHDEIILHSDGSGTYKYIINLSSSRTKINSILALDSINGQRVPDLQEIKDKVIFYKTKLEGKEGISNVKVDANYDDFIFRFSCDFTSVNTLQTAIREIVREEVKDKSNPMFNENWISWDGKQLIRSIPNFERPLEKLKREDEDALKTGKYNAVSKFDTPIEKCDNPNAIISPSKLAVIIKSTPWAISQNPALLKNTITLVDQ